MRKIGLLFILAFVGISFWMACNRPSDIVPYKETNGTGHCPTIDSTYLRTVEFQRDSLKAQVTFYRDSLYVEKALYDSVRANLILSNYRIERVKYYVKICQRKPSQVKFLVGWTRRALNMN